ncbi:MAG TPA: antibiotic biosynthesis monooxygenase [Gaiellaceae bacterium]|nr:antibiotic biosynthesis monooxygenase [Gaiellaceae bacterium]
MTVVSVLRLPVRPGAAAELAQAFEELDVFGHSKRSGGFLGGRFLRPLVDGDPVLIVAEWDSPVSYQRWLDNPVRESLRSRLEPLVADDVAAGQLYEEIHLHREEHV